MTSSDLVQYSDLLPQNDDPVGVYIHVPFCKVRCSYCDFATDLEKSGDREAYFGGLERELVARLNRRKIVVDTLYLGGGTPSLLRSVDLQRLERLLNNHFDLRVLKEFTIEANPGCVSSEAISNWQRLGIDRVSVGIQSFKQSELKILGRSHLVDENYKALELLSNSGMRFNADLMIGTPGQTIGSILENLKTIINHGSKHISVYMLSVEQESPWYDLIKKGVIKVCEDSIVSEMYRRVIMECTKSGINQYEISAFSIPGEESQHNLKYWLNKPTMGFGPSAASYSGGHRYENWRQLKTWQNAWFSGGSFAICERIHAKNAILDTFMLQFRLVSGVAVKELDSAHDLYPELRIIERVNRLIKKGLLELCERQKRVFLSSEGKLFANEVFLEFVD